MGGLLSSIFDPEPTPSYPRPQPSYTRPQPSYTSPQPSTRPQSYQRPPATTRSSYRAPSSTYETQPMRQSGPALAPHVFQGSDTSDWFTRSTASLPPGKSFQTVEIPTHSVTYNQISTLFRKTAQKHQKVVQIVRVENPFLMGSYLLKRDQLESEGFDVYENHYFHGTKQSNVLSICNNNLDWRLHGDSLGNRFGKGISFSPISNYSSNYCDKAEDAVKVMFVVLVLESGTVVGNKNMVLPPRGYDTAIKENGQVVVKFYDDEFYPEYIIYFTGSPINKNLNKNLNKGNVHSKTRGQL